MAYAKACVFCPGNIQYCAFGGGAQSQNFQKYLPEHHLLGFCLLFKFWTVCDFLFSFMVKLIWFVNFRNNIYTFDFLYKNLIVNFQGNLNSSSNFIPYKYILNSQSESSAHASRISIHNKGKKITQWKNPINEIMDMKGITPQALHWIASNLFFLYFICGAPLYF